MLRSRPKESGWRSTASRGWKGRRSWEDFHYAPILFFEGEKVRPDQRRLLELCGLLVGDIQSKQPSHGLIVHGKGLRTSKIEFKSGSKDDQANRRGGQGPRLGRITAQAHPERPLPGLRVPAALPRPSREGGQPQPAPGRRGEGGESLCQEGHLHDHPACAHVPAPEEREKGCPEIEQPLSRTGGPSDPGQVGLHAWHARSCPPAP